MTDPDFEYEMSAEAQAHAKKVAAVLLTLSALVFAVTPLLYRYTELPIRFPLVIGVLLGTYALMHLAQNDVIDV